MKLSDQQTEVAMHGLGSKASWDPRELPTDVSELPDWLIGCHVDLMLDFANSPHVKLKVLRDPWPIDEPKLFERESGDNWVARSSDGFVMEKYHHSWQVSPHVAWRVLDDNGVITQSNPDGWMIPTTKAGESSGVTAERAAMEHIALCQKMSKPGEHPGLRYELREMLATTKDGGFGGRHYHITLKNGDHLVLRGPWHTGSPMGWNDCVIHDVSSKHYRMSDGRAWHRHGGTFGYFFSDDLMLMAVARHQPHLGVAMVYPGHGHGRYEFYDLSWGAPKSFSEPWRKK